MAYEYRRTLDSKYRQLHIQYGYDFDHVDCHGICFSYSCGSNKKIINNTYKITSIQGRKHIPIVASLFLFIVTANLMGQLPWKLIHLKQGELASPTNDINMTAAMAIIVLIYYLAVGIKEKGIHFFYHGLSFPGIVMFLIDLLDMITRPFSLALRLFCNIFVGEVLVGVLLSLCAYFLPLPIMFFEVFVAFVQALVFMMLTIAYISMAVNEE